MPTAWEKVWITWNVESGSAKRKNQKWMEGKSLKTTAGNDIEHSKKSQE